MIRIKELEATVSNLTKKLNGQGQEKEKKLLLRIQKQTERWKKKYTTISFKHEKVKSECDVLKSVLRMAIKDGNNQRLDIETIKKNKVNQCQKEILSLKAKICKDNIESKQKFRIFIL